MRVIPPLTIDASILTSTTVSEPSAGESAWSSGTVYKAGDRAINTTTHRTYESLQGSRSTVTITIASPGVVTWPNHGLAAGAPIVFSTTGALPTGLTAGTIYYVLADTRDTFKLATSIGGTAINTSGSQSGVQTATANPNKGNDPTTDAGLWWLDVGPTNKWAMFDLDRSTGTTDASPLTVVITPGQRIDSLALVGLVAEQVQVTMTSGASTIYDETFDLRTRVVTTWYEHLTTPFSFLNVLAVFDLPAVTDCVLTIEISRTSGDVTCGGVVIGRNIYLGTTLQGAENDATNYSKIERDEEGNASLIRKRSVPRTIQNVRFLKDRSQKLLEARRQLNATPAFWSGLDDPSNGYFEPLQILGVYRSFKLTMDQPTRGILSLELEEI